MQRRTFTILLVVLLLASGFVTLHTFDQPTGGEESDEVKVKNGNLSVDEDEIFTEVQQLLDSDVEPPTITLFSDTQEAYERSFGGKSEGFHRLMIQANSSSLTTHQTPGAYYLADEHTIYVHSGYASEDMNRSERQTLVEILVEEYVHAVQYRTNSFTWNRPDSQDDSTDELLAWQAVKEGGDVYVASEYVDDRFPQGRNLSSTDSRVYHNSSGVRQYFLAPYYFGDRYIRSHADAPSEIWPVYSTPPRTTEQLLHPQTKGEEPIKKLTVRAHTNRVFVRGGKDRQGELFIRLLLSQQLSRENATRAATGWGNDRLVKLWQGDEKNYAWVLRWDSEADAEEFEVAFERYLTRRGIATEDGWKDAETHFRVERISNDTVAAFVGTDRFTANVTAEDQNGTVNIGSPTFNETTRSGS